MLRSIAVAPPSGQAMSTDSQHAKPPFLEELERRVLVCDGAMGTMLYARGVFLNRAFDELNLTQPDLVADVHHAYVRAGADVIETNTFGANRIKLVDLRPGRPHGRNQPRRVRASRGARRANRPMSRGSIGPLGVRIEPWGKTGVDEAQAYFPSRRRRCSTAASISSSSRRSAISTRSARRSAPCAACARLPIVAQVTTEDDGNTLDGVAPELFVPELERWAPTSSASTAASARRRCSRRIERIARVATRAAVGAAERRAAARGRGPQHLSVLAGVHGVVRQALHQQRRPPRRRLLRHDARSHPADPDRGAGGGARGGRRSDDADGSGAAAVAVRRRSRSSRGAEKSRMAHALARGGVRRQPSSCCRRAAIAPTSSSTRPASCASAASTSSTFPTVRAPAAG